MSAVTALPLLMTALTGVGLTFYVLKRKSLAQAICVQQAARLQQDLKSPLKRLIRMNRQAEILRARREHADMQLADAMASGYPPAIAFAQAYQDEVIMEQTAFHTIQLAILGQAQVMRLQGQREFRQRVTRFPANDVATPVFFAQALAVEPRPASSLSPNYEMVAGFQFFQQQRYRFDIDLFGDFPFVKDFEKEARNHQSTECSVTLEPKGDEWDIKILAAKAS